MAESRKAADHEHDQGDHVEPAGMAAWADGKRKKQALAQKFAAALGEDVEIVLDRWRWSPAFLRVQLETAGIDPNTGDHVNADVAGRRARPRADIQATQGAAEADRPAAVNVGVRDADESGDDPERFRERLAAQLRPPALDTVVTVE